MLWPAVFPSEAPPSPPRRPLSRWSAAAGILLTLGLAYILDRASTSALTLLPYLVPIGLTLYNFGPCVACLFCPAAAVIWLAAQAWQGIFAAALNALVFLVLTLLTARHQGAYRRSRDQLRAISQLLPICPHCGQMLGLDCQWRDQVQLQLSPMHFEVMPQHACNGCFPSEGHN